MSKNKKIKEQHTVPVCYLANFGINGNIGRKSPIYFFNLLNNHSGISSSEALCKEAFFYDLDQLGEYSQIIEKAFVDIEGEYSTLLKETISLDVNRTQRGNSNSLFLSKEKKSEMSVCLAYQIVRAKKFRIFYDNLYSQIKDSSLSNYIPDYGNEDFKRLHNQSILDGGNVNFFTKLLFNRKWVFISNHTDMPFITSDNPCIQINHSRGEDFYKPISPASDKITFYIPLSPTLAIEIYDKNIKLNDFSYFDVYNSKTILWYNLNLKDQCTMLLFSNQKDFIDLM